MNKVRLEALSDGVFSIVMTLLVIEIHVPMLDVPTNGELWDALMHLTPLLVAYVVSFTVLMMYWTSHHALFHAFLKGVNRPIVQFNGLYLMVLALIPFSTHLLGSYPHNTLAISVYALHIILLGMIGYGILAYVLRTPTLEKHDIPSRTITQARIRSLLTPSFALLGIVAALTDFYPLAYVLFMFPVIFNLIPGTLDAAERFLGITIR